VDLLKPSYATGYAKNASQSAHPELWRGCVFAAAPCLGPTGLTLRDWSGFQSHGTLTNMSAGSDWVLSGGKWSLDFDGSDDYVNCGNISSIQPAASRTTIMAWIYRRSSFGGVVAYRNSPGSGWVTQWSTSGNLRCYSAGSGYESTLNVGTNTWMPVYFSWTQTSITMALKNQPSQSFSLTKDPGTGFLSIGAWDFGTTAPADAIFGEVMIHNRTVSLAEFAMFASRRGIAYELAPRRKSALVAGVMQYNRRRRLLVGAGS